LCQQELCRGDRLADVPLRVIGDVNEKTAQAGRQGFLAHDSRRFEIRGPKHSDSLCAFRKRIGKLGKKLLAICGGIRLGFQRDELLVGEEVAFGVGEQAIQATSDVTQMKRQRCQSEGRSFDFGVGETIAPTVQVFSSKFQRM